MAVSVPATTTNARPGTQRPRPAWGRWGVRGLALTYVVIMLVIPLAVIFQDGFSAGPLELVRALTLPIAQSALWLTIWTAALMAVINGIMGTITAYVLVRYRFPGKSILNGIVDLPFSIPTLVTGVMLVVLYGPQSAVGGWLEQNVGWRIIFAPSGIILALLFVTFPFVVRAVQPVLESLDRDQEEAASTLGAGPWTIFRRVVLPAIATPLTTGTLLSFARAIGEFGAIVIVAGNIPFHSETAAVYVLGEIESENRRGASAMSVVMLLISFTIVLMVDVIQRRGQREAK